ncbi:MAG: MFS transporter [Bacillota bacterium]|jgi:MFS family permease
MRERPQPKSEGSGWLFLPSAYMLLFSLRFTEVFWVLFLLRNKGLSLAAIGFLETVFHISSLCSEMPTGIIADRWGRKVSLAVGRGIAAVSAALILYAKNWWVLSAAFVLNAISYTCHSGAFEALVYDSGPAEARSQFAKVLGNLNSVCLVGTALAGLAATLMSRSSLELLYKASVVTDVVATAVACLLVEDVRRLRQQKQSETVWTGLRTDLQNLLSALKQPALFWLLLLWGIGSAMGTSVRFYGQAFLEESRVPLFIIGLTGTASNLLAVIPTRAAHNLPRRYGQARPLIVGSFGIPAIVVLLALLPGQSGLLPRVFIVAGYLGLTVVLETLYPLMSESVNRLVSSDNRATVLSSGEMLFSLAMMAIFPFIGFLGDRLGLRWGLGMAAVGAALAMVSPSRRLSRFLGEKPPAYDGS